MMMKAPRIAPLPRDQWGPVLRTLLTLSPGGTARPLNIFTTLGKHPALFRAWLAFAGKLLAGRLSGRERELTILRTAFHCDCRYERSHHEKLAAAAGIGRNDIEATWTRSLASWTNEDDRLLLESIDQLNVTGTINDETWSRLVAKHDEPWLIELVMLVGHYRMVAMTLITLRVQVEEDQQQTGMGEEEPGWGQRALRRVAARVMR